MSAGEFVVGAGLLALTTGTAALFAVVVLRRRRSDLVGAPRLVALALLATLGFFAIHLIPGVLGLLGKPAVAAAALLLLAGALAIPAVGAREAGEAFPEGPESPRASWLAAGFVTCLAAVYAAAHAIERGDEAVGSVDMTTFHLPNVARWIQESSFWQDIEFVPFRSFGTYPNTGDVITLGTILPFDSDFLIRFVGLPFIALTALATYCIARELRAPAASALLFSVGLVAMPVVAFPALDGLPDAVMLSTFAGGLYFLVRHVRTGDGADLVLAAVGLGISFGTKWYAPVAVGLTLTVWLVANITTFTGGTVPSAKRALRNAGVLAGIIGAVGGFWLVRNLVEVGNPVYPLDTPLFDAPYDVRRDLAGFSLSHYLGDWDVWGDILWPRFLDFMSWYALLLWAVLPLAAWFAWRRSKAVFACCVLAASIGVAYLFLPYTAQGPEGQPLFAAANTRYVVPALVLAAVAGAWLAGQLGRGRLVLEALAALVFLDALRRNPDFSGDLSAGALIAGAGAVGLLALAVRRAPRGPALYACAGVLAFVGLWAQQERFTDGRYDDADATARWVDENAPSGARVGVAGEGFIVYQLFGPRLENEVEYVGPTVDHMLRPYDSAAEFEDALRGGDYDLVLVQHNDNFAPGISVRDVASLRRLGFRQVAEGSDVHAPGQRKTLFAAP